MWELALVFSISVKKMVNPLSSLSVQWYLLWKNLHHKPDFNKRSRGNWACQLSFLPLTIVSTAVDYEKAVLLPVTEHL